MHETAKSTIEETRVYILTSLNYMSNASQRITQVIPVVEDEAPIAVSTDAPSLSLPHPVISCVGGTRVGRYELMYHISSGGMASVYAGRLSGMAGFERLVAIKIIHPHLACEQSFVEMFLDEARLAARIVHPNVAEISEVGEDNGVYYMVGELVRGKDLLQIVTQAARLGETLPSDAMVQLLCQICDGLQEAHELTDVFGEPFNLVHRDVSTRNIMVSYKGHPKLIDFGAALAKSRLANTTNGMTKGKIGYMAPEQLRGEAVDHRVDVYALGVVLYALVTGRHPFPYEHEGEQIVKALHGKFLFPTEVNPSIHPVLERIILKAMSSVPEKRFESAAQMGAALTSYLQVHGNVQSGALLELMTILFAGEAKEESQRIAEHRLRVEGTATLPQYTSEGDVKPVSVSQEIESIALERKGGGKFFTTKPLGIGIITLVAMLVWFLVNHFDGPQQKVATQATASVGPMVPVAAPSSLDSMVQLINSSAAADTVRVQIKGAYSSSVFWVEGVLKENPIQLKSSDIAKVIRIVTPAHETVEVVVIPNSDQRVRVKIPTIRTKKARHRRTREVSRRKKVELKDGASKSVRNLKEENTNTPFAASSPKENGLSFEKNPFASPSAQENGDHE